jgi:hypothetical protein
MFSEYGWIIHQEVKRPELEADQLPPGITEFRNGWNCRPTSNTQYAFTAHTGENFLF